MPLDLTDLRARRIPELVALARDQGVDNAAGLKKQELIFELIRRQAGAAGANGSGVLETLPDGFGFLRSPDCNYLPGPDDIYVSPSQIRRFNLRTGDLVRGAVRAPKEGERYFALIKIEAINDRSPDTEREKLLFDNFTSVPSGRHLQLAGPESPASLQLLDRHAPIGFGHRVALFGPSASGRTTLLREMAEGVLAQQPGAYVIVVLVDERPEEVTEMQRVLRAEVLSSTFDEPATRHVQVADMALERAKRMVEQGRDVVLFIDSLSRLARAYNATVPPGGKMLHGVVDVTAIHRARRYFGAGRCLEEGGSLTVVAAVLTGSDSPVDQALIEELEGTANAELRLDASLAMRGLYPAFDHHRFRARQTSRLDPAGEAERRALRAELTGDVLQDQPLALRRLGGVAS
jgi:transcription termination factor Rho